jgi:hypothetical protein
VVVVVRVGKERKEGRVGRVGMLWSGVTVTLREGETATFYV